MAIAKSFIQRASQDAERNAECNNTRLHANSWCSNKPSSSTPHSERVEPGAGRWPISSWLMTPADTVVSYRVEESPFSSVPLRPAPPLSGKRRRSIPLLKQLFTRNERRRDVDRVFMFVDDTGSRLDGVSQVAQEIADILDADAQANEPAIDASLLADFARNACMGHRGGMTDE